MVRPPVGAGLAPARKEREILAQRRQDAKKTNFFILKPLRLGAIIILLVALEVPRLPGRAPETHRCLAQPYRQKVVDK